MAFISIETILGLIPVGDSITRRNDPQYWSGWISAENNSGVPRRPLTVSAVRFDVNGLELTVKDEATTYKLKAIPRDSSHTTVSLNDAVVADAALVFSFRGTIFNPSRYGFDFRPILIDGGMARFNMRYDP